MNYFDVKDKLPAIGNPVKVFFENVAYGGHGIWWHGRRISNTHFQIGSTEIKVWIDTSDRPSIVSRVTHWADLDVVDLPNICRFACCKNK